MVAITKEFHATCSPGRGISVRIADGDGFKPIPVPTPEELKLHRQH